MQYKEYCRYASRAIKLRDGVMSESDILASMGTYGLSWAREFIAAGCPDYRHYA